MGKGIALQFKQAYPENFKVYKRACDNNEVRPGRMLVVPTGRISNPKYVINFPTKKHWRFPSKIEYITQGLADLTEQVERLKIRSIALPPLGCGNGGLDWAVVEPLIVEAFAKMPKVHVLVFTPQPPPSPDEMPIATTRPALTRVRAVIVSLVDVYRQSGAIVRLGRLEMQKLAYLMQAAGESLELKFVKARFGPYADDLNHVLLRLDGHYLRGVGDRSQRSQIDLADDRALREAKAFLRKDPEVRDRLYRVQRLVSGFENPYGMELLATVHWVASKDPLAARDPRTAVKAVQSWSAKKAERFEPAHILIAWERLRDEGWFSEQDIRPWT